MPRRRRSVIVVTAGVLALVGIGATGGFLLHSPGERIVADVPDVAITAAIESRELDSHVTGVGMFEAGGTMPVTVTAPSGMSGVVSANPRSVGETVPWCGHAVEVSGRPVFVLHGSVPAYRDLTEGDSGADVRQLQAALKECGYRLKVDGVFGPGTAAAVKKLYADSGHQAVTDAAAALSGQLSPSSSDGSSSATAQPAAFTVVTSFDTDAADAAGDVSHPSDASGSPATPEAPATSGTPGAASVPQTPAREPTEPGSPSGAPSSPAPTVIAPRGELVFVPAPPRITNVLPAGSYVVADPVVVFALKGDIFTMQLTAEQKAAVEAGQQVVVSRGEWTTTTSLPDLPVVAHYDDAGAPSFPVRVPLPDAPPAGLHGEQGQFTISTGSDQTYPTVVPVAAIYEDTAGQTYVLLAPDRTETGSGEASPAGGRRVAVRVLESVQGYVAIESDDQALRPGGEVVIGAR